MAGKYYAHSGKNTDRSDWQLLPEHLEATAALASARAAPLGLSVTADIAGRYHDFGKYDPRFDLVLQGKNERVDHSTAGGALLLSCALGSHRISAEILAYAILGHHAGLPDRLTGPSSVEERIARFQSPISPEITAQPAPDLGPTVHELIRLMRPGSNAAFDLSVAARMVFSCLVDADFRETEAFYAQLERGGPDRQWPSLADLLPSWRQAFDDHMAGFTADTALNRQRRDILAHIRQNAAMTPGHFTLTVPTGGGKTLASLGFALDHAARHGHRRIILAIPYTSIIDQTAKIFRDLLGEGVLEHHSSIDDLPKGADAHERQNREKHHLAMEDWAAPLVVTTNVQFFESLFAARPSRCRKLHNIAGSVIVLDEAQTLPRDLLLPALRMLDTLCTHYGCSVVFCSATQPAFDSRQLEKGGLPLEGRELAPDPDGLARSLRRARIIQGGEMSDEALIAALAESPQAMIIVNSRAHALELFQAAKAEGLEGLIHLTTRQYPAHRRAVLEDIRLRLKNGQPSRLIATSLIEAGVDLDFPKGWRAEAGLDSCVQAAGRVNRNGLRPIEDSTLTIFSAPGRSLPRDIQKLAVAMRKTAAKFEDLLSLEALRDWFEEVYWGIGVQALGQPLLEKMILTKAGTNFAFREMAETFQMITSNMVPVIVERDPIADEAIKRLAFPEHSSGQIARALQPYIVQIPSKARQLLIENGHATFCSPELRSDQFCVLKTGSLYREETGLHWENADYLAVEAAII